MIAVSDVFTALNGVVMKRTLVACPAINKMGVLFHNSWTGYVIFLPQAPASYPIMDH